MFSFTYACQLQLFCVLPCSLSLSEPAALALLPPKLLLCLALALDRLAEVALGFILGLDFFAVWNVFIVGNCSLRAPGCEGCFAW